MLAKEDVRFTIAVVALGTLYVRKQSRVLSRLVVSCAKKKVGGAKLCRKIREAGQQRHKRPKLPAENGMRFTHQNVCNQFVDFENLQ
jgi:hypothetical protein